MVFALPDQAQQANRFAVEIPKLGSLILPIAAIRGPGAMIGFDVVKARGFPKGSLERNPLLGQWIGLRSAGVVTLFVGKVDIGQGISTVLAQIARKMSALGLRGTEEVEGGGLRAVQDAALRDQARRQAMTVLWKSLAVASVVTLIAVIAVPWRCRPGSCACHPHHAHSARPA
mgnify:CR=1 FL=1